MRVWWVLVLMLPVAQAALLDDAAGDVVIHSCETQQTPVTGFDAMDLRALDVNETPDALTFTVAAEGLEAEAEHDAGNYFIHLRRGEQHYAVRMFQDNAGTGAVAHVLRTESVSIFGPVIAELPATVDAAAGTISAAVPRDLLLDHDGAVPVRGHSMEGLLVSAQAHVTGVYSCSFDGSGGGPAIVEDRMPDAWTDEAANFTFRFGGGASEGPLDLQVARPFRASNGEATIYVFNITVANEDDADHEYTISTDGLPSGWRLLRPPGNLVVAAGDETAFTAYVDVPFQHVHGTTEQFDLVVDAIDGSSRADVQLGVHYLDTPQPSGHHPKVYLHSITPVGLTAFNAFAGGGDNHLYWNTLETDEMDQGVPMRGQMGDGGLTWYGCLAPRLALGLSPADATGSFEMQLQSDIPISGTLSGHVSVIDVERGATCQDARNFPDGQEVLRLEPTQVSIDGPSDATGTISVAAQTDIAYVPGTDLLLTLRLTADTNWPTTATVDLLPGGMLHLPLQDHHEPLPDIDLGNDTADPAFVVEEDPPGKRSPAPSWLLALGIAALARRRRAA